jgi:hypothetical protein
MQISAGTWTQPEESSDCPSLRVSKNVKFSAGYNQVLKRQAKEGTKYFVRY